MKHVAAYMLATLGGVDKPSATDLKKILAAVGIEGEDSQIEQLLSAVTNKNVDELITAGMSKLASMPAGVAAAAPTGAAAAAPAAAAEAPKKVEKEESDEDMGFGLFD